MSSLNGIEIIEIGEYGTRVGKTLIPVGEIERLDIGMPKRIKWDTDSNDGRITFVSIGRPMQVGRRVMGRVLGKSSQNMCNGGYFLSATREF